jgi:hypothetical protein
MSGFNNAGVSNDMKDKTLRTDKQWSRAGNKFDMGVQFEGVCV